jgi:LuxR family maltose regulon positive regulatory protein
MVIEEVPRRTLAGRNVLHQSKITVPPVTGMPRPRLVALVEQGVQRRLTVVSAPAGWGKTTLVAEWAHQTDLPVAWLDLEEADNDPLRFFEAVAAALANIHPLRLDDVLTMLRTPEMVGEEAIDQAIISAIEELPGPTAIVLDDFHLLVGPEQLRSVARVVERMPPWVHLILTTRGDVRLPLARLRAAGEVTTIRVDDLAFSLDESRELLARRDGLVCDEAALTTLVERTEGWAAGLRLASLALRNDRSAIERLRGTQRDIADYFREEVLDRLAPDCQRLLVETSVLDRFTEALALEVTESPSGQRWLQDETTEIFVTPLDSDRRWYRFHPLFRDVLQEEFALLPPERRARVHARASTAFEAMGFIDAAVEHALASCDYPRATRLIESHADRLMYSSGQASRLAAWIEELPPACLVLRPGLWRVQAWALIQLGRLDQAERLLQRAMQDMDGNAEWQGLLTAVQARLAAYRGDHRATVTFGDRARQLLDPILQPQVTSDLLLSQGFAWWSMSDLDHAAIAFAEAARLGRAHGNDQAARWGSRYGALARLAQGRLRDAEAIVLEDLARVEGEQELSATRAALLVTRGELAIERGDLARARQDIHEALPIIQQVGDAKTLMNALVALGTIYQYEGDPEAAREKVRRAEDVFPQSGVRGWRIALLDLRQGDDSAALRWARSSGFCLDDEADLSRGEDEQLAYARIMATVEPSESVIALLERLLAEAEATGRYRRALQVHLVLAGIHARCGTRAAAHASLVAAIAYARAEGFVQLFIADAPSLLPLLREIVRDRTLLDDLGRQFVRDLMARMASPASLAVENNPTSPGPLPEALTTRQLEILRLMAAGQSNREIAEALFIAEGTVKAHIHQITGKLLARNRTEAVATARTLNLL